MSIKRCASIASALLCFALIGCDGKESSPGAAVSEKSKSATSALGDLANKASSSVNDAVNSFKSQYAGEIKAYQDKLAQLKKDAGGLTDGKLNDLIAAAETKFNELKAKVESVKPDQAQLDAIKSDVSKLMADLKSSYEQALARLNELKA